MREYMTESSLGDILDIVGTAQELVINPDTKKNIFGSGNKSDMKDGAKKLGSDYIDYRKSGQFKGSITSQAKKLIATFPVICSNSIDKKTACLISKALERKYVTLLQLLFSSNILTQFGDKETAADYLNNFFNNIDFSTMSVDDVDKVVGVLASALVPHALDVVEIKEYFKERQDGYYQSSIEESSLQDYRTSFNDTGLEVYKEAKEQKTEVKAVKNITKDSITVKLTDADIKKANELVPSLLVINYMASVNGSDPIPTESIIGVKTRLVPIGSSEIIDKVYTKNKDKRGLVNLFRATTGEIKFMKDFLFAIDKAKVDAISRSRKGSVNPIWKVLEKRSLKQKMNKTMMRSNDAAPITTLVVSEEEVEFLKKQYNIYLDKTSTAKEMLDAYNLLCLVIVDESIECAKFLFDEEEWETLSFNTLEREGNDSMYKKVINLMSKVR